MVLGVRRFLMGEVLLEACRGHSKLRYRGTSLERKRNPLGPYRRPMPRVLGVSKGGGRVLMGEVPLYKSVENLYSS